MPSKYIRCVQDRRLCQLPCLKLETLLCQPQELLLASLQKGVAILTAMLCQDFCSKAAEAMRVVGIPEIELEGRPTDSEGSGWLCAAQSNNSLASAISCMNIQPAIEQGTPPFKEAGCRKHCLVNALHILRPPLASLAVRDLAGPPDVDCLSGKLSATKSDSCILMARGAYQASHCRHLCETIGIVTVQNGRKGRATQLTGLRHNTASSPKFCVATLDLMQFL